MTVIKAKNLRSLQKKVKDFESKNDSSEVKSYEIFTSVKGGEYRIYYL